MDVMSKGMLEVDQDRQSTGVDAEPLSVRSAIERYHGALIQFLRRRLRCPDDAQDVAQEAYMRMMRYEGARDIRSPSSMLFRIATNVANDLERAEHARHISSQCTLDDVELVSDRPSPERELVARQDLALLYEAIAELPPKCQQVFLLSRVKHMTYPEIARHCGISVKMVEKHISRALAFCAKKVGGGGGTPS
ncbi:MAG TPA: RNA polymerase sigma factor [Sphingopyxis sp.]|nr:RNA polymerase sigma factor [Sphingopyxis sp.]